MRKVEKKEEIKKEDKKEKKNVILDIEEEVAIGDIILEKGDKVEIVTEGYGWKIQRGKEWDAYEDALDVFGAKELLEAIVRAMSSDDLGETLADIFRDHDYDSPYLA